MKKILVCFLIFLSFGLLFSCSNSNLDIEDNGNQNEEENVNSSNHQIAILYFSATKTTEKVAIQISDMTKGKLIEIIPTIPYSSDDLNYTNDDCRANIEQNDEKASLLRLTDLAKTEGCPLARVVRRELRRRGITHLPVVYSPEEASEPDTGETPPPGRRSVPGSLVWVPASAGLLLCQYVVTELIK